MKILVFLHGTTIMHPQGVGRTREERVRQVMEGRNPSLHDYAAYVPVGNAATKLRTWQQQGAEVFYLSSHRRLADAEKDRAVLQRYGFPDGPLFFRRGEAEHYADIAERLQPDVIIEDDCESMGDRGPQELVYPHIRSELQVRILSIIVPEFGGIDHLPDDLAALQAR